MGGVVKAVVSVVSKVTIEGLGKVVGGVGKIVGGKFGEEIERVGDHIGQVGKVISGEYHRDVKKVEAMQEKYDAKTNRYNNDMDALYDKLQGLIAFHEIFKMAAANRISSYEAANMPEIDALFAQLQHAANQLQKEYSFVIGLTQGAFLQKIVGSILMIIGGLANDIQSIVSGNWSSDLFKRILSTLVGVVLIVLAVLASPLTGGSSLYIISVVLSVILLYISLDGMYAGGAGMSAVMSGLDFILNDILNLDGLIGNDFKKFNHDHEDFGEMIGYVKLSLTLATVASSIGAGMAEGMKQVATQLVGKVTVSVGTTFSQLYAAYSLAMDVKDLVGANKAYKELEEKLAMEKAKIDQIIMNKSSEKMMRAYKDQEYIQSDMDEIINSYVLSYSSVYIDPAIYVPMNTRFEPDEKAKDMLSFGFEGIFQEVKAN